MTRTPVAELANSIASSLLESDEQLDDLAYRGTRARVQTVNLHHLYLARRDDQFRDALLSAGYYTADGWPVRMMLRATGPRKPKRVTGSNFVERLVGSPRQSLKIGLVGALASTGDRFAERLDASGHALVYREHGHWADWDLKTIAGCLDRAEADLALIAVSPPTGEIIARRIDEHLERGLVVGVGGSIDMVTGVQRRAPRLLQAARLEWLDRLLGDPRRLSTRYLREGIPEFTAHILPYSIKVRVARWSN